MSNSLPMLRNPSRLREVVSIEHEPILEDNYPENNAITINVGHAISYNIGDEIESFAVVMKNSTVADVFGEGGLLASFYAISQGKLEQLLESRSEADKAAKLHWQLECRTWDLIQRLYLERTKDADTDEECDMQTVSNHALIQHLYNTDNRVAETKILLDWLRDGGPERSAIELRSNGWFYTKESIKSRERVGKLSQESKIVTMLDPDAPLRQGKYLEEKDQDYERTLVRAMFFCIRSGEFEEAAELGRQSGSHWRAASLRGCVDQRNDRLDTGAVNGSVEGNVNKPLWRRMCFALSQHSGLDIYERALYGALCGDLVSITPVLSTWEDHMWAQTNAIHESSIEAHLSSHGRLNLTQDFPITDYSSLTLHNVLDDLLRSESTVLKHEARLPLRVVQARLITNQVDVLLVDLHKQLQSVQNGGAPNVGSSPHMIRLVVHIVLVLRQLRIDLPMEASNAIIQAYVELLTSANQGDAIAFYAAQLPMETTIECMIRYFAVVEDEEARKRQLRLAIEQGIDVGAVVLRTTELVFEETLTDLSLGGPLDNVYDGVQASEERCIRALEWLNLDSSLQIETLMLGNVLFRKLLLSGKVAAARLLGTRMPDTTLVPQDMVLDENLNGVSTTDDSSIRHAIEYIGYCTLLKALSKYEDWKTLIRERPQEVNGRRDPVGLRQWKSDLARLKLECIVMLREILTGSWCDPSELGISKDDRKSPRIPVFCN